MTRLVIVTSFWSFLKRDTFTLPEQRARKTVPCNRYVKFHAAIGFRPALLPLLAPTTIMHVLAYWYRPDKESSPPYIHTLIQAKISRGCSWRHLPAILIKFVWRIWLSAGPSKQWQWNFLNCYLSASQFHQSVFVIWPLFTPASAHCLPLTMPVDDNFCDSVPSDMPARPSSTEVQQKRLLPVIVSGFTCKATFVTCKAHSWAFLPLASYPIYLSRRFLLM